MTAHVFRGLVLAAAVALTAPAAALAADAACPRIEVAGVAPNAGAARLVADASGKQTPLGPPIATLADVTSAIATRRLDGVDGVGFNVRGPAGARLRTYTASRIGKQMAVVVDGRAHLFTVREAISGDAFWLSPMDAGEARILAGRVNNCVTP